MVHYRRYVEIAYHKGVTLYKDAKSRWYNEESDQPYRTMMEAYEMQLAYDTFNATNEDN